MNKNKISLVLGCIMGILHLLWSILVAVGIAQSLLDWIYKMHFLNNPFTVAPFNVGTAAMLVVFTFVVGYVLGWIFCLLWDVFHKA